MATKKLIEVAREQYRVAVVGQQVVDATYKKKRIEFMGMNVC